MRILRVLLGILTLLFAMPVLAAGALGWWTMQHRAPDGAFHADLAHPGGGRILVVPDVDAILRRDVPFARADQTELRLTAGSGAFVGMATPADLAAYLTGVTYTEISGVSLGRGPLALRSHEITSTGEQPAPPSSQTFWLRDGISQLHWTPTSDRGRQVALIIIAPTLSTNAPAPNAPVSDGPASDALVSDNPVSDAAVFDGLVSNAAGALSANAPSAGTAIDLSVALTAGWLDSTTWGLLILGPVLLLLGLAALAWPQRPREVIYVVDSPAGASRLTSYAPPRQPANSFAFAPAFSPPAPDPFSRASSGMPALPAQAHQAFAPVGLTAALTVPLSSEETTSGFTGPFATAVGWRASVPVTFQQPSTDSDLMWPPEESPTTTEPAREIPTQEFPLVAPDRPMPTAGMQLHLSKPQ